MLLLFELLAWESNNDVVGDEVSHVESAGSSPIGFGPYEQHVPVATPACALRVLEIPEILSVEIAVSYKQHLRY